MIAWSRCRCRCNIFVASSVLIHPTSLPLDPVLHLASISDLRSFYSSSYIHLIIGLLTDPFHFNTRGEHIQLSIPISLCSISFSNCLLGIQSSKNII
ncbi:hypothetical protein L6452_09503 [Arctium lappa]|uniref:Uncharacterized protein n=1 Tax=Arctium lappa TaxID=4217 RepID=A0ACB9DKJ0_ARCLA|nr:hypothetical protein L6452_09503 [Arctium lappa]